MTHGMLYLRFTSHFYFPFDFTSQLNVRVFILVTVYTIMLFLLEWWATERRDLPQEIESISFHTDMFTSILTIPLRAAEVVNRGEMKKEPKLLPESKQRENYICDHRAKLVTKSLWSVGKVIHVCIRCPHSISPFHITLQYRINMMLNNTSFGGIKL